MRTCYSCKQAQPLEHFYATSWMCKPCHRERDRARKGRFTPEARKAANSTDAARERKRRYQAKNLHPEREAARMSVKNAVARGDIQRRADCESCGTVALRVDGVTAVQAHHDDYSKPLEVRWLCVKCHSAWHRQHDAAMAPPADNKENGNG